MPHPSESVLIAFADHELDAGARGEVAAHMEGCGLCRHAMRDLREAMGALAVETALVDTDEPSSWRSGPTARARPVVGRALTPAGDAPMLPAASGRAITAMRWAAAFLLLVGGGAAAMTAPSWLQLLRAGDAPAGVHSGVQAAATPAASAVTVSRPTASAAVSVLPVEGEATVSLLSGALDRDARVIVHVSDRRDVQVTVTGPASGDRVPRFLTGDGRLEVQLAGRGSIIEVEFPSTLRDARVTHDGRAVVTVRGGSILPMEAATAGVSLAAPR